MEQCEREVKKIIKWLIRVDKLNDPWNKTAANDHNKHQIIARGVRTQIGVCARERKAPTEELLARSATVISGKRVGVLSQMMKGWWSDILRAIDPEADGRQKSDQVGNFLVVSRELHKLHFPRSTSKISRDSSPPQEWWLLRMSTTRNFKEATWTQLCERQHRFTVHWLMKRWLFYGTLTLADCSGRLWHEKDSVMGKFMGRARETNRVLLYKLSSIRWATKDVDLRDCQGDFDRKFWLKSLFLDKFHFKRAPLLSFLRLLRDSLGLSGYHLKRGGLSILPMNSRCYRKRRTLSYFYWMRTVLIWSQRWRTRKKKCISKFTGELLESLRKILFLTKRKFYGILNAVGGSGATLSCRAIFIKWFLRLFLN